jgi:hypothetical protein
MLRHPCSFAFVHDSQQNGHPDCVGRWHCSVGWVIFGIMRSNATAPKPARHGIRKDTFGWSVIDHLTGLVAEHERVTLTGLTVQDADDLADSLSYLARRDNQA